MLTSELDHYLDIAISAALEAGQAILTVYESNDFDVTLKSDDSPLTRADRLSHDIITNRLSRSRGRSGSEDQSHERGANPVTHHASPITPHKFQITDHKSPKTGNLHFPVLSEEGADIPYSDRKDWKTFWLVDPLDGTKEFIKRNGEFTVNIALILDQIPVIGVVYVPVTDRLYFGASDLGAFRLDNAHAQSSKLNADVSVDSLIALSNPLPLNDMVSRESVSDSSSPIPHPESPSDTHTHSPHPLPHPHPSQSSLSEHRAQNTEHREARLRIVASRSHMNPATEAFIDELKTECGEINLVSAGSSLKLCLVAEGSADIYPRLAPTMEWDTAAAHGVVVAAGGQVLEPFTGNPLLYNKPDLHNPHFVVLAPELDMTVNGSGVSRVDP